MRRNDYVGNYSVVSYFVLFVFYILLDNSDVPNGVKISTLPFKTNRDNISEITMRYSPYSNLKCIVILVAFATYLNISANTINDLTERDTHRNLRAKILRYDRIKDVTKFYKSINSNGVDSDASSKEGDIKWNNIVIIMMIYDNEAVDQLIQAHFNTWIKHLCQDMEEEEDQGFLDIVFVTDTCDKRSDGEILAINNNDSNIRRDIRVHLHRSNARNEGNRARYKAIDAFQYAYDTFSSSSSYDKKYYLKIDSDTLIVPQNMIYFLNDLNKATLGDKAASKDDNPVVHFGAKHCFDTEICWTQGNYSFLKEFF